MSSPALTLLLLRWQSSLRNKPTQPWLQRANSRLRRSKWSQALILAWMVRCAADMVLARDAEAIRVPLRYFTGMYACVFVVRFFRRRGSKCSAILFQLATASAQLEETGCPETKELLVRSARILRWTGVFYTVFRTTQIFGVIQSSVVYHSDSAAAAKLDSYSSNLTTIVYILNVDFANDLRDSRSSSVALQATAMVVGLVAFYQMQTLVYVLFGSCAVLWRALGYECERSTAAALHALLLQAARSSRLLLAGLLFQWLPVILVLPLLATVELIVAFKVDLLALTCFTVIGTIFVPVCITGQMLEDTSAALSDRLYNGPWVEESWKTRRLRLQFMAGATRRANLAVQGLGSLNAPTCLEAIRRWFGFINVLLNLQY
ncbi:Odorant receptor 55 [Frankliniella occidentalis]|nr:Odorant receptor 55 [Frankliniella occidentalis]